MFQLPKILFLLATFVGVRSADARIFSFENETIAPYVGFRAGFSSLGASPYDWQSVASTSGDSFDLVYGGEFGVYFRGSTMGVGAGVLVTRFDPVTGGLGSNGGGAGLFTVDSNVLSYGPTLFFDYQFKQTKTSLWKVILGGGYLLSEIENSYAMTATGQPLVGGQASFSETYTQDSPFLTLAVGTEFAMSGATTISVTLGYQYMLNQDWKYKGGGQNFSGVYADGGDVLLEDGSRKKVDLSYPFIQVGFQFYVDIVR